MIHFLQIVKYKILFCILLVPLLLGFSQQTKAQEVNYKSQSLYIYLFTKNIHWPESYNKRDFVIGVFGNSPIFNELKTMASLKKAGSGQKIVIKKVNSLEEITEDIHLVYITSSKSREVNKVKEKIGKNPTLVVAERDGLAKKGAAINFIVMENDALKFEINEKELKSQNLQATPDLLAKGLKVN